MKTVNQNCPVCGIQIQDGRIEFCSQCNWELIVISDDASQGLKNFYSEKLKRHKDQFAQTKKLNEVASSKSQQIDNLEKEKSELESKNESFKSEIVNMNDKVKNADSITKEITQLKKDYEALKEKYKDLRVDYLTITSGKKSDKKV